MLESPYAIEPIGGQTLAPEPIFVSTGKILTTDFTGKRSILENVDQFTKADVSRPPLTYSLSDAVFQTSDPAAARYLQIDGQTVKLEKAGSPEAQFYRGEISSMVAGENVSFEVAMFPEGTIKVLGTRSIFVEQVGTVTLTPVYQNKSLQVNAEARVTINGQEVTLEGYADRSSLLLTSSTNVLQAGPAVPFTLNYHSTSLGTRHE